MHCTMVDSSLTLDDVFLVHGRVVVRNIVLRGGHLRIKPAEMRHPSLDVRVIGAENAEVDVPVPERMWKVGRATGAGDTPQQLRT